MSTYRIEIDDDAITEQIRTIANQIINDQLNNRIKLSGIDYQVSALLYDIVYKREDEIIEAIVERASAKITKKALAKLMDKLTQ